MGNSLQLHRRSEPNESIERQNQVICKTCEICIEPLPEDKVFINNKRCVHPFCLDCIPKYIETKVADNIGNIPCPALDCKQLLDPLFCRSIISKQLFDKWCDTLCSSTILKFRFRSYCPNQRCSALVINECKGIVKKVKCPNCKEYFCFKCQNPWHAGYRCVDAESGLLSLSDNDVLFGELMENKRWCICYNCGQCIERVDGCRIIHCRCGATTCYDCGEMSHMGLCGTTETACCEGLEVVFCVIFTLVFGIFILIYI